MKQPVASFDLAIVGSGFGGSLLALIARQLGLRVVLLERERHPRFAIGESSTPLANLLIEELARRYELPELHPFTKWGTWVGTFPSIACGLKRGFTFYHHRPGTTWHPQPGRKNELLVAASPRNGIADTHWYRADIDHAWARLAVHRGVELIEDVHLEPIEFAGDDVVLHGRAPRAPVSLRCQSVIDATGPRGFLARSLGLKESSWSSMPRTQSLFSHFRGVKRWDALCPRKDSPPYPVDDAAMHHVFPGGWIWVLRFNNGLTSAGVAATPAWAERLCLREGGAGWARLLAELPSVAEQFSSAEPIRPFTNLSPMPWRVSVATGTNWALLPSAAGFVDPLLSTGFPLTLLGIERLASALTRDWNSPRWPQALKSYEAATLAEVDLTADLIGALYGQLDHFDTFTDLTMLYFAAASYAETARRLHRPELADGFLLRNHAVFGPALRKCLRESAGLRGPEERERFSERVRETIDVINVAGLANPERHNWYPVRFDDLYAGAAKLNADRESIDSMLRRLDEEYPE